MSAAIGAALKKIAVALLTDKKVLKTVGGIILGVLIIIFIPIFTLLGLFTGNTDLDTGRLQELMIENMEQEKKDRIQHIEDTMEGIEEAMREAGFSGTRITEAQMIFSMALEEQSYDSDFISKLVESFSSDQTDEQLIADVNEAFGSDIDAGYFTDMMASICETYDIPKETQPSTEPSTAPIMIEGG